MTAVRKIAAVGIAPLLMMALAGPADAHGALSKPISRSAACGPEGGRAAQSKACRAAMAVSDPQALRDWDNLRVPGVGGRERRVIPDGKLCSGGLDAYKGLDLARPDWPATRLTSGARVTFAYRTTIPHPGTFKLYVTRGGYEPTRRLRWSDLEPRPFVAVTNPPLRDGSYIIKGRLPRGKSGRHMIYTIWRNSGTPDTYYSCSDVVFRGRTSGSGAAETGSAAGKASTPPPTPRGTQSGGGSASAGGQDGDANDTTINAANKSSHSALPLAAGGGAVALALAGAAAVLFTRRQRLRRLSRRSGGN